MASAVTAERGGWWRFSEYEVVDGRIRPKAGARLSQYDPWENFRLSRSRGGTGEPPYQSLLRLLQEIDYRQVRGPERLRFEIKPDSEPLIAAWCSRHGLLGSLPQTLDRIDSPAVAWALIPETGITHQEVLHVELPQAMRVWDGWRSREIPLSYPEEQHQGLLSRCIELGILRPITDGDTVLPSYYSVTQSDMPGFVTYAGVIPPHADWLIPPERRYSWNPGYSEPGEPPGTLTELARLYFPSVLEESDPELFIYPVPLTPPFWYLYSETIDTFMHRASWLQNAVQEIAGSLSPRERETEEYDFLLGKEILDFLTSSANNIIERGPDGDLRQAWLFPSLLSSYAMMIAEDLIDKRALHVCPCGTPFLSKAYQVKYCSDRCRYRYQKREQRKNKGAKP